MFVSLRIITLPPDSVDRQAGLATALEDAATALPGLRSSWVAPVSPVAVINAGHVVWRATFASEAEALAAPATPAWRTSVATLLAGSSITTVGYQVTRSTSREAGRGIWRALVFRVLPNSPSQAAAELEEATLLLPRYVPEIRAWALSRISTVEGPKAYTHVWEQEFDDLQALTGPYMRTPVHYGLVDGWFDAEYPQYIVDPHVIQVVGDIADTIIAR